MGFWKGLGKVLLKAAPIAAAFIPGVGPLASMAIGGLTSGISKKLEGGSWKDALISGGIGAGTGFAGAKLGGIGPSSNVAKSVSGVANKVNSLGKSGFASTLGKIGKGALGSVTGGSGGYSGTPPYNPGASGGWQEQLGGILGNAGQTALSRRSGTGDGGGYAGGQSYFPSSPVGDIMPQGGYDYQHNPMNQANQNNPNLASSIFQGRQEALGNPLGRGQNYTPSSSAGTRQRRSRLFPQVAY